MIEVLAVENYRSMRRLVAPLGRLTVVTGANGSGKSSLYRALRILADSARNGAVAALAREGGLSSALWAGPKTVARGAGEGRPTVRSVPAGLRLGFGGSDFGYAMELGQPPPSASAFSRDPEIKREAVWAGPVLRPAALLAERSGGAVRIREDRGWYRVPHTVQPFYSMLAEIAEPEHAPELLALRERIRTWRFYDHLRTDALAPVRAPQLGTRTLVLSHDGSDLAAALQTIREIGDDQALEKAVELAFPGSRIEIVSTAGRFELLLHQPGMVRPLGAAELSDGTLRYLLWAAALLTPRSPALLVLNEPETSLHPELIGPLAALITDASRYTQIIVVTHTQLLVAALREGKAHTIELHKDQGETTITGQGLIDEPPWHWPAR